MIQQLTRILRSLAAPAIIAGTLAGAAAAPAQATLAAGVPDGPFNALVFGDYRSYNADSWGALIVGGRVDLHTYGVNSMNASNFGLWTAGGGSITNGHVWSHVTSNVSFTMAGQTGGQVYDVGSTARLGHLQSHYSGLSSRLATDAAARTATRDSGSGLMLVGDAAANRHVFNVDASVLPDVRWLDIRGVDAEEELVINIFGQAASFTNLDLSDSLGKYRTLLNYVDATLVHFKHTSPWADVLAPLAKIVGESGHIQGTLVAAAFDSQIELHMGKTRFWDVPDGDAGNAVPVPGSLALSALGLFAVVWVGRRPKGAAQQGPLTLAAGASQA